MFRVLGFGLIIENAFKNLEKWPNNQENMYQKEERHSLLSWYFMALFRAQSIHLVIQKQEKWPESQK